MAEASRQPVVSCVEEKGQVITRNKVQEAPPSHEVASTPKPPCPAGLTYCFLGCLQIVQPVPQSPRGLM